MRYILALLLLTACSGTQMVKDPVATDPGTYSAYLEMAHEDLAITYKVDAPALGTLGSNISMYKKKDIVRYDYNEYSYYPSTSRLCSGDNCRSIRPESDPDKNILALARVFNLNEELPQQAEYKGEKQAGERPCQRYFVHGMSFEDTCSEPVVDICIDLETVFPLYVTVLCNEQPAIIWTTISVSNTVDSSMFE